ncbi:MAG: outer membrane beta-barrel protein [Rikenellaceae bacterium]
MNINKNNKFDKLLKSKFDAVDAPNAPVWGELFGENFESDVAKATMFENMNKSDLNSSLAAKKTVQTTKKRAILASLIAVAALLVIAVIFRVERGLKSEIKNITTPITLTQTDRDSTKIEINEEGGSEKENVLVILEKEDKILIVDNYIKDVDSVDGVENIKDEVVTDAEFDKIEEKELVEMVVNRLKDSDSDKNEVAEDKTKDENLSQKERDLAIIAHNATLLAHNGSSGKSNGKKRLKFGAATTLISKATNLLPKDLEERIDALEDYVAPPQDSDSTDVDAAGLISKAGLNSTTNTTTKGGGNDLVQYIPPSNFYNYTHKFPITFAVDLNYEINDRFSLGSGINYTHLSSSAKIIGKSNYILDQKLNYLGIPLTLNYDFKKGKNLSLYGSVGVLAECIIANNTEITESVIGKITSTYKYKQENCGALVTSHIGLGLSCKFVGNSRLFALPALNILVDNNNNPTNYKNNDTFSFSLKVGIAIGI